MLLHKRLRRYSYTEFLASLSVGAQEHMRCCIWVYMDTVPAQMHCLVLWNGISPTAIRLLAERKAVMSMGKSVNNGLRGQVPARSFVP